jgi:hypothetical protein
LSIGYACDPAANITNSRVPFAAPCPDLATHVIAVVETDITATW